MKQITKFFLPLFISFSSLEASQQLIVIISNDFNAPKAEMRLYEKNQKQFEAVTKGIMVNIGRNGLGWGLGQSGLTPKRDEPHKKEGDGKAPAGIFKVSSAFGYAPSLETSMPYIQATQELICVDDVTSEYYNKIADLQQDNIPKSFEWMHRKDDLYKMGLVIDHNREAKRGAGSCIFFHIQKSEDSPTAGCSAMKEEDITTLIKWLDPKKEPLLVQIPKSHCSEAQQLFTGIICP